MRILRRSYVIIAVIVTSLIFIMPQNAYSDLKKFTIKLDKEVYSIGETIHVCGIVPTVLEGVPVAIQVFNPRNVMYAIGQPMPDTDGKYSFDFRIGGKYGIGGDYTVKATYFGRSAQTTFTFEGLTTDGIKVDFGNDPLEAKTILTNGNVLSTNIDTDFNSLVVAIRTCETEDGELHITLPRALIDSRFDEQDQDFIVLIDGAVAEFEETGTDLVSRTLTIPVPASTEVIEVVGSQVIPEFPVNLTIASVAIGVVLAMTRFGRLTKTWSLS